MFSVRLVTADSYQATPLPQLDATYSEFRGAEIKNVPIVRVFGTTPTGEKTCLHLHGVFPYMYVPFTGEDNPDAYPYKLAASLDAAINISLGSATSNTQHVYQIQRVAGIPYYGYHKREHQFFKVSFYNPTMMKKAIDLLQNGSVLNARLQPHEAHIPYILQFMMDYNLHGMSLINLTNVKYRRVAQLHSKANPSEDSIISPIETIDYLPCSIVRQSVCQLEVDALISDIQNRQELQRGIELNPGLAAIWKEERARRAQAGLPSDNSQLINPTSPKRPVYHATESDIYQQQRLNRRLQLISQCDNSTLSTSTAASPYPLEVNDDDHLINASNLGSYNTSNSDESRQNVSDVDKSTSFSASRVSKSLRTTHDSSLLDVEDMPLVDILMELAQDSGNRESIDDDSVLGTQSSVLDNGESNSAIEDEEDVTDLNITCSELDHMRSQDNIEKSPSQLVPVEMLEVKTAVLETSCSDTCQKDTDVESHNSEDSQLPQFDGAGDLASFLESDEDESIKGYQELKRVSESETPILKNNLTNSNDEAFIVEELISRSSKPNENSVFTMALIRDNAWPTSMLDETSVGQFGTMSYEPLGSVFESDLDSIMRISPLLPNNDDASVSIDSTVEDDGIPLEDVLNGDPCFTQTAEMDKSDFVELQDQYVSLLDSALVPDIFKNVRGSDTVNNHCDESEEDEMISLNLRPLRFMTNNRNYNLSLENVTPNIREPDAKVYKNKFSLQNPFERMNENSKDLHRLPIDSPDHNCNVVATWAELQDSEFIPKRISRRKGSGKARRQVLARQAILSDSVLARRSGRFRKGLTNVKRHVAQDNLEYIADTSSNTPMDVVSLEIEDEGKKSSHDRTSTTVENIERTPHKYSTAEPRSEESFHDVTLSHVTDVCMRISLTDHDLTQNLVPNISPDNLVCGVENTLPSVQYYTCHVGASENVVKPIFGEFSEFIVLPAENEISLDNDLKHFSYYSSTRSHSGVSPFGKHNHRHCYYSFMRMKLMQDYVFTPDEIWVVEERKRGKIRPSPSTVCNRDCRLPFIPLQKLKMLKTPELNMSQLTISEMGSENSNLTYDSSEIDTVEDNNCLNDAPILHELSQSKSPVNIDAEYSLRVARGKRELVEELRMNYKIDIKNGDYANCDEQNLPTHDSASTQSAHISSTQNHCRFARRAANGPVVIRRIFNNKSYEEKVGQKKRSIILKLDDTNDPNVVDSRIRSSKIVALSIRKRNDNGLENMIGHHIQAESVIKKPKEKNSDSISTSITMKTERSKSHLQVMNTINRDDTKITEISSMMNRESNIISSSDSESAILVTRPEIWCSIDRNSIDLRFVTPKNNVRNIANTFEFFDNVHMTSPLYTEPIPSQIFDQYDDTGLNVHACDSLYKDEVTSINSFGVTESTEKRTTWSDHCDNNHESEQYTIAVAEANFYAGKNYTIDAISLEIPQCLFEEDSNSECIQKKSEDLSNDNALYTQSVENLFMSKTTSDGLTSNNHASITTRVFDSEIHEDRSDLLTIIDKSSSGGVICGEILKLNDVIKPLAMLCSKETNEPINENESLNECNYSCMSTSTSSPEPSNGPLRCHDNCNRNFDEKMIARMMNSILVLREYDRTAVTDDPAHANNSFPYEAKVNYCPEDSTIKITNNDSNSQNFDNSFNNTDKNALGFVFKCSPNKISIIRRIYSSRNKILYEKTNTANTSTNNATSSVKESEFCDDGTNNLDLRTIIEESKKDGILLDKVVSGKNKHIDNIETPSTYICFSPTKTSGSPNNKNNPMLNTQIYLHDDADILSISSENSHESIPINGFIYETNSNQVVCRFDALTVKADKSSIRYYRGQNFVEETAIEAKDLDSNYQNDKPPSKHLDNIMEYMLVAYDSDHNDRLFAKISSANHNPKPDASIGALARPQNLSEYEDVNNDGNQIWNLLTNESLEALKISDSGVMPSVPKSHNTIPTETREIKIGDIGDKEKITESHDISQSPVERDDCHNHPTSIDVCQEVSVVLERIGVNDLNKYLKNDRKLNARDMGTSIKTSGKRADARGEFAIRKKCVKFNEQVFVFDTDERMPLIDVEDQAVEEKKEMESSVDRDDVPEVIQIFENAEAGKSIVENCPDFMGNDETAMVSENVIIDYDELFDNKIINIVDDNDDDDEGDNGDGGDYDDDDDTVQMGSKIIEKVDKNRNDEKIETAIHHIDLTNGAFKENEVAMRDSVLKFNSRNIDICCEKNGKLRIGNEKVTREQKKSNILRYADREYNSDRSVNRKEGGKIRKFDGEFKEIGINCAIIMKPHDESLNERSGYCVRKEHSSAADGIELKNDPSINNLDDFQHSLSHNKISTVIETKAMSYSNITSVIHLSGLNNLQRQSRYKRKRNNIPDTKSQSSIDNTINDASTVANQYESFQDSDRIVRSYRTSSGYRNKVHTVSIDKKMIFTKVTISDQQLGKKSPKERFLSHIGLCTLKPRGSGWLPKHTMIGSIQLQQPHVVLQRLAPSVLKYYGYTRRFKSNKFGKRFKVSINKFTIPAYDGPADLSSSDSESDSSATEIHSEKRVCVYQSLKKRIEREAVVTPKKRKQSHCDEEEGSDKRKHTKRCTPQRSICTLKTAFPPPHRTTLSPGVSGHYSPLKITVTSPRICKVAHDNLDEPRIDKSNVFADFNSMCTTPNTRKQLIHEDLLRSRIVTAPAGQTGNARKSEMNIEQRLLGELNILDTYATGPTTQSRATLPRHVCQSQDISPNTRDTLNVRKNLFHSTDKMSPSGLSLSQHDASTNERSDCIECTTLLFKSKNVEPGASSYINLHVDNINNDLEDEDNDESVATICEQGTEVIPLEYSPSIHAGKLNTTNGYELCNVTFTQYLSSHEQRQQSSSCRSRSQTLSKSEQTISILPKFSPPTIKQVIHTMETYNIPKFKNSEPFFSNQADAPGQKEIVHKMLNVPGRGVIDLSVFESTMKNITGINRWRKMKINEFHLARGTFKSKSIRQSLAAHAPAVITPLLSAPSYINIMKWLRVRDHLEIIGKKERDLAALQGQMEEHKRNMDDAEETLKNKNSNASDSSIVERLPERINMSNWKKLGGRTPIARTTDELLFQAVPTVQDIANNSTTMPKSAEIAPSLESILAKSALFKKTVHTKQFGISCGQIEYLTTTDRSNVDNENMQNCKALTRYQFITTFCVEVHVVTRYDLLPNPQYDPISALFYAIQSDVPPTSTIKPLEHGVIIIRAEGESKSGYCSGSNIPFVVSFVADEKELFNTFIDIVNSSDAEILIGWEIESLSWGYIFQRALRLGINLIKGISRVPASQWKWDNQMSDNLHSLADMKLPGRIVLDIWRIMKSEIALLTYTFENVMYHVMNERLPRPSFKSLTRWWQSSHSRWKVLQHYGTMILGILRILEQLDIIGRTSEFARLFGIQFYEVFSRGSQYRVESLMLRLAKPLNYVVVSPSPQQRSSMRAMEALPLIMEPESMFYSDPVVVLDFQSLYPSIIIAHNYCYSTCLGRVEHIGQPDPFEFGASVLRIPKHTALKLEGKVNYSPCGVAFVKSEVRCGILPRMLTEILNTRLMVKKAMKDHSQDDKLLQRVLHFRQKGLKDLANVTYGYTAANFTGRMPCIEVGDSVVSKAKETLERAIKLVESTPQWGARVIYGDTDSLFILVPGKTKNDAFNVGYQIANAVTASNLSPIKLKFEKILYPAILQSKKRYCGYMYETPDQNKPKYLAKGIETVRRDGCPAVSKILEASLRILFDTKDVSLLKQYVTRQLDKVLSGKVSLEDLTFAKEFRGINGYMERACVPALELTRRMMKKDPRAVPRRSERVRYVIVAGAPNQALIHCVRSPWELIDDPGLRPNGTYYVTRVIIPPLNRCLNLMGVDVNTWYKEMPHRQLLHNPVALSEHKQKQTISQFFGSITCTSCGRTSNRGICNDCLAHPTETLIMLHERLRWLERINDHVTMICQSCIGRGHIVDCVSLDCPVLYRRVQAQRDLTHGTELRRIIQEGGKLDF